MGIEVGFLGTSNNTGNESTKYFENVVNKEICYINRSSGL